MKTNKPKKYQYNCQLIDAWLTNQLPEAGGYYTGSSAYLECDATHFWVGRDQEFLLAVKNRDLLGQHVATLVRPVSDIPFTGAVHDAIGMVAGSFSEERSIRYFVPTSQRQRQYDSNRHETRGPTGIPTLLVPKLEESMSRCSIESLHPIILDYYDRNIRKHVASKHGLWAPLLGYFKWKPKEDQHSYVMSTVRKTFEALGIPFNEEWNKLATLRAAKLRLAA